MLCFTARVIFAPMPRRLVTQRLLLTPEEPSDADWLAELFTARGLGAVTAESARERIETMTQTMATDGIGALVMRPLNGAAPVGYCALITGRATLTEPEIAYEVLPQAQGQGYATEAAQALVRAAWTTHRHRLWSTVRPWNAPSRRVMDKIGFAHHHLSNDSDGDILWFTRERPRSCP